jgi:hypothetical protein
MATVGSIVASALWLLRVVDPEESPGPAQYERCIETLNRAMARLEGNRTSLGWAPVSNPDEAFPLDPKHEDLAIHVLAAAVRPVYGSTLDPDVLQRHRELLADLHRDMAIDSPIQGNHSLPGPDSGIASREFSTPSGAGWA